MLRKKKKIGITGSNPKEIFIRTSISPRNRCYKSCAKFCNSTRFGFDFLQFMCTKYNDNTSNFSYIPLDYYVTKKTKSNKEC